MNVSSLPIDREIIRDIVHEVITAMGMGSSPSLIAQPAQREYYTVSEVASRYGLKDNQTVRNWLNKGKIAGEKNEYSKQWLIPQAEIQKLDKNGGRPL